MEISENVAYPNAQRKSLLELRLWNKFINAAIMPATAFILTRIAKGISNLHALFLLYFFMLWQSDRGTVDLRRACAGPRMYPILLHFMVEP